LNTLNSYAGLGGNREKWPSHVRVTAVEMDPKIAKVYSDHHPNDIMIVGDAHQYLLDHYKEFDFIWSSPPCQSHSRMGRSGRNKKPRYPDFRLYEEIQFLKSNFDGKWVVENVTPYYKPLYEPTKVGRHLFWSNFAIGDVHVPEFKNFINRQNLTAKKELQEWLGIHYDENIYYGNNHCPTQILRNCVHPDVGLQILNFAIGVNFY